MQFQAAGIVRMDLFARGTLIRTGHFDDDYTLIEDLSCGDYVYDPVRERYFDIVDCSCQTLARDTAQTAGFSVLRLDKSSPVRGSLMFAVRGHDLSAAGRPMLHRNRCALDEGESEVFYRLVFEGQVTLDTRVALCTPQEANPAPRFAPALAS
jgi:hypothetical protein